MEFWPTFSQDATRGSSLQKKKSKASLGSSETSNYPVIDHGSLVAATLVKDGASYGWEFVHSTRADRLVNTPSAKIFPSTRTGDERYHKLTLQRRAEHGARFLRTYYPDIDIPDNIIKDGLLEDDEISEERSKFDPFQGNMLSILPYFESRKKSSFLAAFPTGDLRKDLNLSPVNIKRGGLIFRPRTQAQWSFNTPICQITASSPDSLPSQRKGQFLAVRTYSGTHIFDVRKKFSSPIRSQSPHEITELFSVLPTDLNGHRPTDMFFSASTHAELYVVTERGIGFRCSTKGERRVIEKVFDKTGESNVRNGWKICTDHSLYGGILASENIVQKFDTRMATSSLELLTLSSDTQVITSVSSLDIGNLHCVSTTKEVIWLDQRFPKRPLLGWNHHRRFDRSLNVENLTFDETTLTLLSSGLNGHISAIAVGQLTERLLQCTMSPTAITGTLHNLQAVGRALIRYPSQSYGSVSLIELSDQGSLHHTELKYSHGSITSTAQSDLNLETKAPRFTVEWSDEVKELDAKSLQLRPDYGKLSAREVTAIDLSNLYENLFGECADSRRNKTDDECAERVYETLDKMPSIWQHSDANYEYMSTLFDVAFASDEGPLLLARADFLTGSILNSARGYRARRQDRLPAKDVARTAAWHMNLKATMNSISPGCLTDVQSSRDLEPYKVIRHAELPDADRREENFREEVALDLALSEDIYSAILFKPPPSNSSTSNELDAEEQEPAASLTLATEKLSLTQNEPPRVHFGYHRPSFKDKQDYYKDVETERAAGLPPGVSLLLSEWKVGDDPTRYQYVDPYGEEEVTLQKRAHPRWQKKSESIAGDYEEQLGDQSQAPPTIVAARSIASTQPKPSTSQQLKTDPAVRAQTNRVAFSQVEMTEPTSSQPLMTNTQVLSGPFGGRQPVGKKKPQKKRVQGF